MSKTQIGRCHWIRHHRMYRHTLLKCVKWMRNKCGMFSSIFSAPAARQGLRMAENAKSKVQWGLDLTGEASPDERYTAHCVHMCCTACTHALHTMSVAVWVCGGYPRVVLRACTCGDARVVHHACARRPPQ